MSCSISFAHVRITAHHVDCVCHSDRQNGGLSRIEIDDASEIAEKFEI